MTASLIGWLIVAGGVGATGKLCDSGGPAPAAPTAWTVTRPANADVRAPPVLAAGRKVSVGWFPGQLTSVLPSPLRSQSMCCGLPSTSALSSADEPATTGAPVITPVTRGGCAGAGPGPGDAVGTGF